VFGFGTNRLAKNPRTRSRAPLHVLAQSPSQDFYLILAGEKNGLPLASLLDVARCRILPPQLVEDILRHSHGYWQQFDGELSPVRDILNASTTVK